MIRILICDDEGIVRESLKYIIEKNLEDPCEIETAKNGRSAIEMEAVFRPDIILMDIQMPGINGLDAMWEIRKTNKQVVFLVLTAYEKFEYTQKAISIGVMDYLTKPIPKEELIDALKKAIAEVKKRREKMRNELEIKEKLEVVVPMIESGFVYSIMMNVPDEERLQLYLDMLNVQSECAYVMVVAAGDELRKGVLTNAVGAGIRLQKHNIAFRDTIKRVVGGFSGSLMENKVIVVIPCGSEVESYESRLQKIEQIRNMQRKLESQFDMKFKMGMGSIQKWETIASSYREAMEALHQGVSKVNHIKDLQTECLYEDNYPIHLEKALLQAVKLGKTARVRELSRQFLTTLPGNKGILNDSIRLKAIEFVLFAEYMAYSMGGRLYRFGDREGYLGMLMSFQTYEELVSWFVEKMMQASRLVELNQQEKTDSVIEKGKTYIKHNFSKNISLDELAKELAISPYYLSKLFKDSEGVNYIDYVTRLRVEYAKQQLLNKERSVKEICLESGYTDPNYFSRIFKKWTGYTPTEYREGGLE